MRNSFGPEAECYVDAGERTDITRVWLRRQHRLTHRPRVGRETPGTKVSLRQVRHNLLNCARLECSQVIQVGRWCARTKMTGRIRITTKGKAPCDSRSGDRSMTSPVNGEEVAADTARLRGLGTFPRVQVLLGELITDQKLIPSGSQNVSNLDTLPGSLRASIQRAERQGGAWSAWTSERELFAVTGDVDASSSRMHAKPVLRVLLYDGKGRIIGSSKWLEVRPTRWTSCES